MKKPLKTSEEKLNKSRESYENAWKWWQIFLKWIKEIPGSLRNIIKWTYRKVNGWETKIWENKEEKLKQEWKEIGGRLKQIMRRNLIKILLWIGIVSTYWTTEIIDVIRNKQQNKIEITVDWEKITIDLNEIFDEKDVIHDLKWSWKEWQDKRYNNYLWDNEAWNKMKWNFWIQERIKVIEWFFRMIESWDINMIFEKADEAWVPRQCIYLALAESWRKAKAKSRANAWWYWQFTPQSALDFGLNKEWWKDNRWDKIKSTEAAMRHLVANYKIVKNYEKELKYNLSESDRRFLAFCMYNWSPKLVKLWMVACKWNINNYPSTLIAPNWKLENNNYVPRILALQDFIEEIFKENNYDIEKVKEIANILREYLIITADKMYENYQAQATKMTIEQRIDKLKIIMKRYDDEQRARLISKEYHEWAINVIKWDIMELENQIKELENQSTRN